MTNQGSSKTAQPSSSKWGETIHFENLSTPGCYIQHSTGYLLRVPEDGVKQGRSPVIEMVSNEPMIFTRISSNPYCTITKARMRAADLDIQPNF
jgi:hypothetical protein